MNIYVDTNKIEYNNKKAYPVLKEMEVGDYFHISYGVDAFNDLNFSSSEVAVTNVKTTAEQMAKVYPDKRIYLIENPLNKGYKSTLVNLEVVWCWSDFQFFVTFPRRG